MSADREEDFSDVQANTSRQLARSQTEVYRRSIGRSYRTPCVAELLRLDAHASLSTVWTPRTAGAWAQPLHAYFGQSRYPHFQKILRFC